MPQTFVISGVSAAQLNALEETLIKDGATVKAIAPFTFEVSGHGVDATAIFSPDTGDLNVTINSKPWYVPVGHIESGLRTALGLDQPSPPAAPSKPQTAPPHVVPGKPGKQ